MQFITSLFGGSGNTYLTALFALGAVIVLIILAIWLMKLLFRVSSNGVRGRNRRLSIVDSLVIDQKRQLLIIRRDNVEHLILTGGNHDLVVEGGIVPPEAPAQSVRRPIPMMGGRKVNATEARPAPVTTPAAAINAGPGAAIDRAREANRAKEAPQPGRSLRHTGLLRPVDGQDAPPTGYKADISPVTGGDSAKEGQELPVNESITRDNNAQGESKRG